jgi:hypothetical protein
VKKSSFVIFGLILLLGFGLYWLSSISNDESDQNLQEPVVVEPEPVVEEKPVVELNPETEKNDSNQTQTDLGPSIEIQKVFARNLQAMGACLETQNSVPGEELEPSLRTLVDSVRGEWGESVITTEDWMQIEMETPEGEKRRIRVEMDFDSETQVQRKLKYTAIDQAGQTRPIEVAEDQAVEPSESLIASLESGNKILMREKFERVYFQNGEEIVARQANGFLTDIEINRRNKSFKCSQVNQEASTCQCL